MRSSLGAEAAVQGIQLRRGALSGYRIDGSYPVRELARIRKRKVEVVVSNLLPFTGTEQQHPGLYALLIEHERRTGCPMLLNTSVLPRHLLERLDPVRTRGDKDAGQHAMSELTQRGHAHGPRGNPLAETHRNFACTIVVPWVSWLDRLGARELSEVPE
jgi:hypothetical protein